NPGTYNGFCHLHNKTGSWVLTLVNQSGTTDCRGFTVKGLHCKNAGTHHGYCYLHIGQSRNVIPKTLTQLTRTPLSAPCMGMTVKGLPCGNYGTYDGFCHYHVEQRRFNSSVNNFATLRCAGMTKKFEQCKKPGSNNGFCHLHEDQRLSVLYIESYVTPSVAFVGQTQNPPPVNPNNGISQNIPNLIAETSHCVSSSVKLGFFSQTGWTETEIPESSVVPWLKRQDRRAGGIKYAWLNQVLDTPIFSKYNPVVFKTAQVQSENTLANLKADLNCLRTANAVAHAFNEDTSGFCTPVVFTKSVGLLLNNVPSEYGALKEMERLGKYWLVDEQIDGDFAKYNSNDGFVGEHGPVSDIAQAFSHYSFFKSGRKLLLADIQGSSNKPFFTDVA
ncbi:hypothetical protein HDU79_002072, partial [Rhizoclosmatium sp. JEL0117]